MSGKFCRFKRLGLLIGRKKIDFDGVLYYPYIIRWKRSGAYVYSDLHLRE